MWGMSIMIELLILSIFILFMAWIALLINMFLDIDQQNLAIYLLVTGGIGGILFILSLILMYN